MKFPMVRLAFDVFIMPSVRPRPEHVSLNVLERPWHLLFPFV